MKAIDVIKMAHFAENSAIKLRRAHDELELKIKTWESEVELARAQHIMTYAETLGSHIAKEIGSSSVVAMKRKALEAMVLDNFPFNPMIDLNAERMTLISLANNLRQAREDAQFYRMLFLNAINGDIDIEIHDPRQMIDEEISGMTTTGEINVMFAAAEQGDSYEW